MVGAVSSQVQDMDPNFARTGLRELPCRPEGLHVGLSEPESGITWPNFTERRPHYQHVELVTRLTPQLPEVAPLRESAGMLDQFYVATRYPNGLPGGVPFEAFGTGQARTAIEQVERFVALAKRHLDPPTVGSEGVEIDPD